MNTINPEHPQGRTLYYEGDDLPEFDRFMKSIGLKNVRYAVEVELTEDGGLVLSGTGWCPGFFCPADKLQALYDSGHAFGS